nr:translation initiation factor 1 [Champereia manillana var. longistaminea]
MFRVRLDNENLILGSISGRIQLYMDTTST